MILGFLNRLVCALPGAGKFFLPEPAGYVSLKDLQDEYEYIEVFPEKKVKYLEAHCLYGEKRPDFAARELKEHSCGVWTFKNGIAFSDYGYILLKTERGLKLIRELSLPSYDLEFKQHFFHKKYKWRYFNRIRKINGTVAVVNSTCSSHNYYHWLLETLPRLALLEKSGIIPDYYYISVELPFHKSAVEILDIPYEKIISPGIRTCVCPADLIVPSLLFQARQETCKNYNYLLDLPGWTGDWLKKIFLPKKQLASSKKIYISRKGAPSRKIINEPELIAALTACGFETIETESLSLSEQAELFYSASAIVAPHGAALANLVFCQEGTKVIELFPGSYIYNYYWLISNKLKLDYSYCVFPASNENNDFRVETEFLIGQLK